MLFNLCFLRTAICQRDTTFSYADIEQNRDNIIFDLFEFFKNKIWKKFPSTHCELKTKPSSLVYLFI